MNKRMTLCLAALGLAVFFPLSTSHLHAKEFSFPFQKEFALDQPLSLEIEDPRGEIILESHDLNKIIIQGSKVVESRDNKEAEQLAQGIKVDIEKAGATVKVKTTYEKTNGGSFWHRLFSGRRSVEGYTSYHIFVPKEILRADVSVTSGQISAFYIKGNLDLASTSGDIEASGAEGEIRCTVTSGNIQAKDLKGKISLEGTSSDIQAKNLMGEVRIDCTSGSVNIEGLSGTLKSSQTSGDLEARGIQGEITSTTTSGNVSVEQTNGGLNLNSTSGDLEAKTEILPAGSYSLKTTSGALYLSIARNAQAELKIETTSGDISMNVPMVLKTASRYSLSGSLGKGGGKIEIETVSGDINIEEY